VPERPQLVLVAERPAIGKTTVARRLTALLARPGVPLAGFVTEELRERSRRVGFAVETFDGAGGVQWGIGMSLFDAAVTIRERAEDARWRGRSTGSCAQLLCSRVAATSA